ncbi:MAG TPA: hypothetical protein VL624_01660, partial [Caldimonas sp.]|nr:hypothetical protein [Caldimonas sp.]
MAAAFGLHADRQEHVGAVVLRIQPGVEVDRLRRGRQLLEVAAFAPDQHEVAVGGQGSPRVGRQRRV